MLKIIKQKLILLLSAAALVILLCPVYVHASQGSDSFWIKYIDVGQGDAALVQCDGHYMLIDGGPSKASSTIYSILKNLKINTLDYIIATHPDTDHIGGLSGALNYATVKYCLCSDDNGDNRAFRSMTKYLKKQGITITVPDCYTEFFLGSASVEVIWPDDKSFGDNNNSLITKVTYGDNSFLFMGDAEISEENYLIAEKFDLSCDVIKIGHHGSASSTSPELLSKAGAEYGIISSGKNNSYGHPADSTVLLLEKYGINIIRTDMGGDITFTSDGKNISFTTEKKISNNQTNNQSNNSANSENGLRQNGVKKDKYNKQGTSAKQDTSNNQDKDSETKIDKAAKYVLNTNTKKFHSPSCSSVSDMKEKNKEEVTLSRNEIIDMGYDPCKRCKP